MSREAVVPFGPEVKDPLWRWGAWAVGVVGFAVLLWIATLGGIDVLGWWCVVLTIFGILLSMRSGRAYAQGRAIERHFARQAMPTVDVKGQPGSTYVIMEPARRRGVRPEEFGPIWWSLYSLLVRAPVAMGDVVLTTLWRIFGGGVAGASGLWGMETMDPGRSRDEWDDPGSRDG